MLKQLAIKYLSWCHRKSEGSVDQCIPKTISSDSISCQNSMEFKLVPANGGMILSSYRYDPKTDRSTNELTIIGDDENVAEAVGNHVMMTMLRMQVTR